MAKVRSLTRARRSHLPIGGRVVYSLDPERSCSTSWRRRSNARVRGRTAFGERSRIPFHVTSLDWQESDRVLAGIAIRRGATARGSAVTVVRR
jgi:hypothetical protein